MSILFGIITLLLSILIPTLVLVFTDFQIMGFALFFVIPVGSIAIGYLCGFGYFKGLVKSNVYISKKHFIIGLSIALLCIFGLKYTEYALTYVDPYTGDIVYSLSGEDHISNYEVDGYGPLTFLNYTRLVIESTPISFSYKTNALGEVSNPIVSWVFSIIDYIGLIAGCLYVGLSQRSIPYCQECQLYMKKKKFIKIPRAEGQKFFEALKGCQESEAPSDAINALLDEYSGSTVGKRDEHFLGVLTYCSNCNKSIVGFELYELNAKKQLTQNNSFAYNIEVDDTVSNKIINQMTV